MNNLRKTKLVIASSMIIAALFLAVTIQAEEKFYEVGFQPDLKFLDQEREERLDLYYPKNPSPGQLFPGVVIIHGGGWIGGDKGAAREINIASNLARAGYVCVSINYVLAKKGKPCWPEILYDCKRAVQYLRVNAKKLNLDPKRIGCIGGSAGGHLSAMLGVCGPDAKLEPPTPYPGVSSKVKAAVDLYGIADLATWRRAKADGTPSTPMLWAQTQMLGATQKQNSQLWKTASPIFQADPKDCPLLLMHGTADTVVAYEQTANFAKRLKEIGLEHESYLIEGAKHTFDLRPQGEKKVDVRQIVMSFFDRHLQDLSPEAAKTRYKALLDFEKKYPRRASAEPWRGAWDMIVKEVASDHSFFVVSKGKTNTKIMLGPRVVYATQRPGSVKEIKNGSLVSLRGTESKENAAFQATSILRYAEDCKHRQYATAKRLQGLWHCEGDVIQVIVKRKKHLVSFTPNTKVTMESLAKPDVLKVSARIARVNGKRLGFDLFASRILIQTAP